MTSFVYTEGARKLANKELDLDTDTIKATLVMTNTTCNTEREKTTNAGFTTVDEANGAGYTAGGVTLGTVSLSVDTTNHLVKMLAANSTFTAVAAGSRQYKGVLVYAFITNFNASAPLAYFEPTGFPFTGNGSDVVIQWGSGIVLQLTT